MSDMSEFCQLSDVTNMNETCCVYAFVMSESCHIWVVMSHVSITHMRHMSSLIWVSHVTYEWVMSHMSESCHIWVSHVTYEWVMSHMSESCHMWVSFIWDMWVSLIWDIWVVSYESCSYETWLLICDWHDSMTLIWVVSYDLYVSYERYSYERYSYDSYVSYEWYSYE